LKKKKLFEISRKIVVRLNNKNGAFGAQKVSEMASSANQLSTKLIFTGLISLTKLKLHIIERTRQHCVVDILMFVAISTK